MLPVPRRYAHFVFGVLQSGLTSAVAAAVACAPLLSSGGFVARWLQSWLIAWGLMLPLVMFAAPFLRHLAIKLTRDEG